MLKAAVEGKLTEEWREAHKDEIEPASVLLEKIRKEKNKDLKYAGSPIDDDKQDMMSDLPDLPDGWVWVNINHLSENDKNSIKAGPFGSSLKKEFYVSSGYKIYFESYSVKHYFSLVSHGGTMEILNLGILKKLPIPIPSLLEQKNIIDEVELRLSIADKVEFIINAELKRAERLRQSILKQAFSGNLVPQDPTDEPASVLLERIKHEKAKNDNQRKGQKSNGNTGQMKLL